MTCQKHNWFFDIPCPTCTVNSEDPLDIPAFLRRGPTLYRDDNMAWVDAPEGAKVGDEFTWAGHHVRVIEINGTLRYKELSYTPPDRRGLPPKKDPQS